MRVAVLSPIAWRTPPVSYGPWETVASLITEGLVKKGIEVTLYATGNSQTKATLRSVAPVGYEEDKELDPKVVECLHISQLMEEAHQYDIIHNHFDFLPLSYSKLIDTPLITTIHGFSSEKIIPIYKKYNKNTYYISISNSDRHAQLSYYKTIYHGVDTDYFKLKIIKDDYLLYFGRIHPHKGTLDAIQIAKKCKKRILLAGLIQDQGYFDQEIQPFINNEDVIYSGNVGGKLRTKLVRNASALLHPIYFEEPFGLSVVEAMACGTPVIAYNRGSMPELIIDSKTGFLVDTKEEAVERVQDVSLIKPESCREHVENKFSKSIMIEKYIEAYKDIITSF